MSSKELQRRFARMGARLEVTKGPWLGAAYVGVRADRGGEYFHLGFFTGGDPVDVQVLNVQPRDRHLLLLTRVGDVKSKFLCGYDERHWFVAAVPESARGVTDVATAKEALQPEAVRARVERIRPKDRFRRRNHAHVRQGEWFFVPAAGIDPPEAFFLRDEPLIRGNGTAHVMQFAYRRGGEVVYVNNAHPAGIDELLYGRRTPAERRSGGWTRMVREPEVYASGAIRHPDHATVQLAGWHRVLMNTEQSARAMRHVAFID